MSSTQGLHGVDVSGANEPLRIVPVEETYGPEGVTLLLAHHEWDLGRLERELARPSPTPCPACHGRGYVTEDPAPECPSVAYLGTESECSKCEGTGEVAT